MNGLGLFWDWDGTLCRRDGMWTATLAGILADLGAAEIGEERIRPYFQRGFPWHEYETPHAEMFKGLSWWAFMEGKLRATVLELTGNDALAVAAAGSFRERYLDAAKWRLFDDSMEALDRASSAGYKNFIVSNHVPELGQLVASLGIADRFAGVYNSGLIGYEKPHSGIYRYAIEKSGIGDPARITMIGDAYLPDVVGAKSNGMNAILVRSPNKYDYEYWSPDLRGTAELLPIVLEERRKKCS